MNTQELYDLIVKEALLTSITNLREIYATPDATITVKKDGETVKAIIITPFKPIPSFTANLEYEVNQ